MFGIIAAGRMVDTNLTQVDSTKYLVQLHDAPSINHLVVFLLGSIPFPPGFGATVHFLWPSAKNPSWTFLGIITNEKPSAIFKLGSKGKASGPSKSTDDLMEEDSGPFAATVETVAQLGISIEPMDQVLQAQGALNTKNMSITLHQPTTSGLTTTNLEMAHRILESLYNYITSFATHSLPLGGLNLFQAISNNPSIVDNSFIPVKAVMEWYRNTIRKIETDPYAFHRSSASEMDTS